MARSSGCSPWRVLVIVEKPAPVEQATCGAGCASGRWTTWQVGATIAVTDSIARDCSAAAGDVAAQSMAPVASAIARLQIRLLT